MRYEILGDDGSVINTILASAEFVGAAYPGRYREVTEIAPQSPVPSSVTMRQARLALLGAGLLAAVNSAVAAMAGPAGEAARIEWEYSGEVWRNKALVQSLAPALGLSDSQLDALFVAAAAIQ